MRDKPIIIIQGSKFKNRGTLMVYIEKIIVNSDGNRKREASQKGDYLLWTLKEFFKGRKQLYSWL